MCQKVEQCGGGVMGLVFKCQWSGDIIGPSSSRQPRARINLVSSSEAADLNTVQGSEVNHFDRIFNCKQF